MMIMSEIILLTTVIMGAILGTVRTLMMHNLKLITPSFSFKDQVITVRLGFIASALLGAIIAFIAVTGIYAVEPSIPAPQNIYEAALFGGAIGFISLDIANRIATRFGLEGSMPKDIDQYEFTLAFNEINFTKVLLVKMMLDSIRCLERVNIIDDKYGGMVEVICVPKPECDAADTKKEINKFIAQYRPVGVMFNVRLPDEILIDINLTAIVLDYTEKPKGWYEDQIAINITKYINSLMPGQWIRKASIITEAMSVDRQFIKNIPMSKFKTIPEIAPGETDIVIGQFEVARANNVDIEVIFTPPGNGV